MAAGGAEHVLTVSLLSWVLRGRRPGARVDQAAGRYCLSFGSRYKCLAVALFVVATSFAVLGIVIVPQLTAPGLILVGLMFGSMWLAGLYAVFDAFLVELSFSAEGLTWSVLGRPTVHMPWSRVESVEYATTANWFTFRSLDKHAIRVSIYRDGLGTFEQVASEALKSSPVGKAPYLLYEKARNPT